MFLGVSIVGFNGPYFQGCYATWVTLRIPEVLLFHSHLVVESDLNFHGAVKVSVFRAASLVDIELLAQATKTFGLEILSKKQFLENSHRKIQARRYSGMIY